MKGSSSVDMKLIIERIARFGSIEQETLGVVVMVLIFGGASLAPFPTLLFVPFVTVGNRLIFPPDQRVHGATSGPFRSQALTLDSACDTTVIQHYSSKTTRLRRKRKNILD